MKATGGIILARAREKVKNDSMKAEGAPTNTQPVDVSSEQLKYKNFWVGIQTRIAIQKDGLRSDNAQTSKDRVENKVSLCDV